MFFAVCDCKGIVASCTPNYELNRHRLEKKCINQSIGTTFPNYNFWEKIRKGDVTSQHKFQFILVQLSKKDNMENEKH